MHETQPHSGTVPVPPLNAGAALAVEVPESFDDPAAAGLSTRPAFPGTSSNEEPATEGGPESSRPATEATPRRRARGPVARARLVMGRRLRDLPRPSAGANLRFKVAVVLSFVALVAALVANRFQKPDAPSDPAVAESEEPNPEAPALQIAAADEGARRPDPPSPEAVEPDRPPAPAVEAESAENSTLASPASPLAEPPAPADPTLVTSALEETPTAEEPAEPEAELPGLPDALNASPPVPAPPIDEAALAPDAAVPATEEPDPLATTPEVEGDDPAPSPLAAADPPAPDPALAPPPSESPIAPTTPPPAEPEPSTAAPALPEVASDERVSMPAAGAPSTLAAPPAFTEPVASPVASDATPNESPADPLDAVPPASPPDASPIAPAPSVAIAPPTTPAAPVTPTASGPVSDGSNLSTRLEPSHLQFSQVPEPSAESQAPAPEAVPATTPSGTSDQIPATPPPPTAPATEPVAPAPAEPDGEGTVVGARIEPIIHVVRRNETFFTIAKYYYGSGRYWRALWAANRDQVPRYDVLYVGTRLRVPAPEDLDHAYIDPPGSTAAASPSDRSSRSSEGATGADSARLARRDEQAARTALEPSTTPASRARPIADGGGEVELDLPTAPASSNATEPPNQTTPDQAAPRRYHARAYTVKDEYETLRTIARDVLRDARRAREIFDLNTDLLSDPDAYVPRGTRLKLPEPTDTSR